MPNNSRKTSNKKNNQSDLILNAIADGFVSTDPAMNITYANKAAEALFSKSADKLIGKNLWKCFPEMEENSFGIACTKALKLRKKQVVEDFYPELNRWLRSCFYPTDEGVTIHIENISDQQTTLATGYGSMENFYNFFNATNDFLWVLDLQGTIIDANSTVFNRLKYNKEELLGQSVLMAHPNQYQNELLIIVSEMLAGKRSSCPIPLQGKDGTIIPVETFISQGQWNGKPALFGVSKDISQLKFSEEKFKKAFYTSPNIVGISDIETGEYVEVNQTFYELLEYTPEEIAGKKVKDLVRMDDAFREKALKSLKEDGTVRNLETIIYSKTGKPIHVLLSSDLININDKTYNFTTGVDITALKQTENALRNSEQTSHFLLSTATELTGFTSAKQVYAYAAKKIHKLLEGHCIVAVVEYNHKINQWKMQHLEGVGKYLTKLSSLLNIDIQKLGGKISTKYYDQILSGRLSELPFDFPGFFNGIFSDRIGHAVKKLLNIEKMYCIGFKQNDQLFGNITFISHPNTNPFETEIIESFVAQIGNFINRIKAEEFQRETENQFKTYIENAPYGIFVVNKKGQYLQVNEEACRVTGFSKNELLKKKFIEIVEPEYYTIAEEHFKRVASEGKAYGEIIGLNKNGEKRWWSVSATKITDNEYLGFHQDITNQKIDSENLLNQKKSIEIILQTTIDGFWIVSMAGKLLDVNEAYAKMAGYSKAELLNMFISEIDVLEDPEDTHKHIQQIVKDGSDFFQTKHRRKDGSFFDVEISVTYQPQLGGQLICFCRDITDRKQYEEKLAEITQYLNNLISNANAPIVVWDTDFKITRFNTAFELMTGLAETFVIGKSIEILFPQEKASAIMRFIRKSSKSFSQWETVEIPIKHADGSERLVIWNSANILDKTGTKIISTIAQGQDITERKKAEDIKKELLKRFQILGEHLPGFIYQYRIRPDKSSHFPYASPGIQAIYGVKPEDVRQDATAAFQVIHPDDLEQVKDAIEFSALTLNPWHESYRVCLPDGKISWVEGNATPQKLEDNSIVWHGYIQDVTSNMLVQDQLARSEKNLQYLLDLHRISEKKENEIRNYCLEASLQITQSQFAFIGTVSKDQKILEVNTWSKSVMETCETPVKQHIFNIDEIALLGASVKQQKTIVVNDYDSTAEIKNETPFGHVAIKRFLSIPIFSKNSIVAVGAVANKATNYTDTDIRALSSLLYELWNITELRAGKNEIQKLSTAMQQSPASVVITNIDGIIEYVNPKFTQVTGYLAKEVLGKKSNLLKSGKQAPSTYTDLWETISSNKEWRGELHNRKKDGSLFWEAVSISPIFNQEGEKTHYIAIKEDITEKKITEQKLLEAHKISKLATFELHWESKLFTASENMASIYGYDNTQQLTFDDWLEFVYPADRPFIMQFIALANQNKLSQIDTNFRITRSTDNEIRWIHAVGEIQYDTQNQPASLIGTIRDITDLKHYENELIAAKEKAEESNQLKNAFLQNLSHEVRTPLNGIMGFSDLLNETDLTEKERKTYTDIIIERGWQLTSIINDILTISAIETGQEELYNDEFNINDLISNYKE